MRPVDVADVVGKAENYLLTASDPRGPWTKLLKIDAKTGIDGSLFFDGDDAWYLSNRQPPKQKWSGHCQIWMQRIDLAIGRLFGEKHVLTDGFGNAPRYAEGPHLYKIGGYYYWVNERVDEEGVRKDLQWMKENGITRDFLATDIRNRTRIRFNERSLFEVAFPDGRTESWNPETGL